MKILLCLIGISHAASFRLSVTPRRVSLNHANVDKLDFDGKGSLAQLVSSPERYASALNLTVDQLIEKKEVYRRAAEDLYSAIESADTSMESSERNVLKCRHRLKFGRHPFVCPRCWTYQPICVCGHAGHPRALPSGLEVAVWVNFDEWGLTSNTGSLLSCMLSPCTLLMRGLPEHDSWLAAAFADPNIFPVVLFPSPRGGNARMNNVKQVSLPEVDKAVSLASSGSGPRVLLIAVDATWRTARRMVSHLPPHVARLDLGADVVFFEETDDGVSAHGTTPSLLSPLRRRKGGGVQDACTAEAVVGALRSLGHDLSHCHQVLSVARRKVDLTVRYRGKAPRPRTKVSEPGELPDLL